MIEYYNKDEFMTTPVELLSITETQSAQDPRGNVVSLLQKESMVLHIGDHEYDVRDLVYRLLRAECDTMALMETVADLQAKVEVLEKQMIARKSENDYSERTLDDFISKRLEAYW